jgi:hypothetical protein
MQEKLFRLAAQLDERYFELSDNTDNITPEASLMFQKSKSGGGTGTRAVTEWRATS